MSDWLTDIQGYTTILDANGDPVKRRRSVQILGATVTDNGTTTIVDVPGGGPTGATGATGATGPTGSVNLSHAPFVALTISSNTITIDLSQGGIFSVTLSSNVTTVNYSNITNGEANFFTLRVLQDGTGGRAFTPPASWKFTTGAYVVSSAANAVDQLQGVSFDNGTTWLVSYLKNYA